MGQCFSNTDDMQKIAKSKQNIKMSQKVNIREGAQCYASNLQIFTRQVRYWSISLGRGGGMAGAEAKMTKQIT